MSIEQDFLERLHHVLGERDEFIPLHAPVFGDLERELVLDCVESGWVSSVGQYVDQFEEELARFCGVKRAVAVSSGTAALHIGLLLAGVESGDEVLMPSLSFVATANAANMLGASPHFVDVCPVTLGLDPVRLESYLAEVSEIRGGHLFNKQSGRRISAVVPMHAFGHPVELTELLRVCERYNLLVVEDAAESLGSYYQGKHTGGFGLVAAVSFNGNKIITTGGGGAILTNDNKLADRAKHLTTTAKVPHRWDFVHDERGYNYRMPNLNAALGVAQLKKLPEFLVTKRVLAEAYCSSFENCSWANLVREPEGSRSNYWLCSLLLNSEVNEELPKLLEISNSAGIMTRPVWSPLHQLSIYADCEKSDLDVTLDISQRLISLPSGVSW